MQEEDLLFQYHKQVLVLVPAEPFGQCSHISPRRDRLVHFFEGSKLYQKEDGQILSRTLIQTHIELPQLREEMVFKTKNYVPLSGLSL